MAVSPSTRSTSAGAAKKPQQRGPQRKLFHFFVRIVDASGNPIQGAQLQVERIISDARKVIEFMDEPGYADKGLTRIKHEVIATTRGDRDGASQVG